MKLSLGTKFINFGNKILNVKDNLVNKIEAVGNNLKN
jgi:hypothetical protein